MVGKKTIDRVMAMLLLALFCSHLGSVTLFPHTHLIDGVIICHSHPYSGSPDDPGHSHSTAQYDTIAHLSALVFVLAALTGLSAVFLRTTEARPSYRTVRLTAVRLGVLSLRGPPAC